MDRIEGLQKLRGFSLGLILLGILLVVLGIAALGSPWVFTLTSVMVFGWLLILGGAIGIVSAILAKGWHGFGVYMLIGVLDLVVGFLMVTKPLQAASVVTLFLAILFLGSGLGRIIAAVVIRFHNWGWAIMSGLVSVLLGGMIWAEWPESSLWVIGTFIGVEFLFRGWAWIMLGLTVRKIVPAATKP
ncbi:HdeD family acid-resistance protein [soil metagenome]